MIDLRGIRNIILDLGGVILEIDVDRTIRAFHALGFPPLQNSDIILSKYPFFLDFEIGMLDTWEFMDRVREVSGDHVSEAEILDAWNAMILEFRKDSIRLLLDLRKKFRLFLLSNTNALHAVHYNRQLMQEHGIPNLDEIFEKVYYSHEIRLRKPDPEIFRHIIRDAGLIPSESLFIDDIKANVETAQNLELHAYQLVPPERLTDVL